MTLHHREGLN